MRGLNLAGSHKTSWPIGLFPPIVSNMIKKIYTRVHNKYSFCAIFKINFNLQRDFGSFKLINIKFGQVLQHTKKITKYFLSL